MVGYDSRITGVTIKWNIPQDEFVMAALLNTKYYGMKSNVWRNCPCIYAGIFFFNAYFKCACLCVSATKRH